MASSSSASSSASVLPSWPPKLSEQQTASLAAQATDYALAHGLIYRPIGNPPSSTHAHHAPISLFPSPFPRSAFTTALGLQPILNELYARVALDDAFLEKVIGGNVAKVDDFQKELWNIYKTVKSEGKQPAWHLGLFRSDYLLHSDPSSSALSVRQVEFNTISSSFGPLCARAGDLHRFLLGQTDYLGAESKVLRPDALPRNTALQLLADGLARAHKTYLADKGRADDRSHDTRILFVVQDKERNAFDQRWLEYELLDKHGIRTARKTFTSLIEDAKIDSNGTLRVPNQDDAGSPIEVSTIYYRSGYAPGDYTSEAHWDLRLKLERSAAIKCPTVALQLAGAKKVQQVLSEPGVVEAFLPTRAPADIKALRDTWAALYPLDAESELGQEGLQLAQEQPQRFVMKPQREGGGNNIYRGDIPTALQEMGSRDGSRGAGEPKEREGYILMELIVPPSGLGNYLIRPPSAAAQPDSSSADTANLPHPEGLTAAECRLSADVVSELGIYGVALFKDSGSRQDRLDLSHYLSTPISTSADEAAYLLRTKGRESDEGGVAVGFSVLDSVVLV